MESLNKQKIELFLNIYIKPLFKSKLLSFALFITVLILIITIPLTIFMLSKQSQIKTHADQFSSTQVSDLVTPSQNFLPTNSSSSTTMTDGATPLSTNTPITVSPGPIYYGAYSKAYNPDPVTLSQFETDAGKKVAIDHIGYYSWNKKAVFPVSKMNNARAHGSIPIITWPSV